MAKTKEQTAPAEAEQPDIHLLRACHYFALVAAHPYTPASLREGLLNVFVNILANASGYNWSNDEEGLRFMLPRLFFHTNDEYATGIIHALDHMIDGALPRDLRDELKERGRING